MAGQGKVLLRYSAAVNENADPEETSSASSLSLDSDVPRPVCSTKKRCKGTYCKDCLQIFERGAKLMWSKYFLQHKGYLAVVLYNFEPVKHKKLCEMKLDDNKIIELMVECIKNLDEEAREPLLQNDPSR